MLCELYAGTNKQIEAGVIGQLKMTRIHKNETLENDNYDEALRTTLYADIKFLKNQVGKIDEVYAKSSKFRNTIIMLHHENKNISHIAVNFDVSDATPVYRVEIVGDGGIIDYDSSRDTAVKSNYPLNQVTKTNLEKERNYIDSDKDECVMNIIKAIYKSIEEGKPVRFAGCQCSSGGGQN